MTSNAFFTVDVTFDIDVDAGVVVPSLFSVLGSPSTTAVQIASNVVRLDTAMETPSGFPWDAQVDFTPGFAPEQMGTVG